MPQVHSIFQISMSRNTICAEMVYFRKDGHICPLSMYVHMYIGGGEGAMVPPKFAIDVLSSLELRTYLYS